MKIFFSSDHRGFALKKYLLQELFVWIENLYSLFKHEYKNYLISEVVKDKFAADITFSQYFDTDWISSAIMARRLEDFMVDLGPNSSSSVDYPDYAEKLAYQIKSNPFSRGILICGTGIGMSIAANRFTWVRGALCRTINDAIVSRFHNNANVLILGADGANYDYCLDMCKIFLLGKFDIGGRHELRVRKLSEKN